jgi:hypothetical protein
LPVRVFAAHNWTIGEVIHDHLSFVQFSSSVTCRSRSGAPCHGKGCGRDRFGAPGPNKPKAMALQE